MGIGKRLFVPQAAGGYTEYDITGHTPYIWIDTQHPDAFDAENDLQMVGNATFTGDFNNAAQNGTTEVAGVDAFVSSQFAQGMAATATPSLGTYGSIIAWVYDTGSTARQSIFGEGNSTNTNIWCVFRVHDTSGLQFSVNNNGTVLGAYNSTSVAHNAWTQVGLDVTSSGVAKFYVNGVQTGTTTYDNGSSCGWFDNVSGNRWTWGAFQRGTISAGFDDWNGNMAELRVYVNQNLSSSDFLAHYNGTKANYGL